MDDQELGSNRVPLRHAQKQRRPASIGFLAERMSGDVCGEGDDDDDHHDDDDDDAGVDGVLPQILLYKSLQRSDCRTGLRLRVLKDYENGGLRHAACQEASSSI